MLDIVMPPMDPVIDIVGIKENSSGRKCEWHEVCGDVLEMDSIVRFHKVQLVEDNGTERSAIAAVWVTDGVKRCRVGFLPKCYLKKAPYFEGKLAQVTGFLHDSDNATDRRRSHQCRGIARACLIGKDFTFTPQKTKRPLEDDDVPDKHGEKKGKKSNKINKSS